MLDVRVSPFSAPLRHRLRITRSVETEARTVIVRAGWRGIEGLGEAAPIARYGESIESAIAFFNEYTPPIDDPYMLDALLDGVPLGARCGLDIALHDIIGKDLGQPLWRLLGVDPSAALQTAVTIGIEDIATVIEQVREHRDAPILKVKLGLGSEIETLQAIRSTYTGTIFIDANEGWDAEEAVTILRALAPLGIELCEQPIPAGQPAKLRWIRERVTVPIVADEDSVTAADLGALIGCVDGVNIKLAKCGGIRAALRMIHTARALGFKILIGCMLESSILATAAAHLTPLVDWADIDGPLLISAEQFAGVRYDRHRLVLPTAPGLGTLELPARADAITRG